jgi:hypothetical protein
MFTLSDITTIGTKKHMAAKLYTKVADLLETELGDPNPYDLPIGATLGCKLLLVTNPNLDGFRFAIDEADFMEVFEAKNVEFVIYPTFYDTHVGMRLAIEDLVLMGEVPEHKGKPILESLTKQQLDKLAEAMAWLNEAYAEGL